MDVYSLTTHVSAPFTGDISNVSTWQSDADATRNPFDVAEDLAGAWNTTIKDAYLDCISNDSILEAISVRRITSTGGPTFTLRINASGAAVNGVVGDTALSVVISWIPMENPWQFGHEYIPCVGQTNISGNAFADPYLTTVGLYANLERQGISAGAPLITFQRCIYQRKTRAARLIQGFEVKPKPASLSRRLKPYG